MSGAVVTLDRPRLGRTGAAAPARPLARSDGGRLTLGQKLDSVWEGLRAGGAAECPVCGGELERAAGARRAACGGCGSTLA